MSDHDDPQAEERVGRVLNEKWTLERLLGKGGMAAVYAAKHRNGARAAVKVLHPELARIPEVRERFLREGYAANRVEHRGAVQVLDDDIVQDGEDKGSAFIVMELLEGEALEERALRDPPMTEQELLEIVDAVLEVLEAAHAHGVVHRDLKPENLFLARDEERGGTRVKVLDFGLARLTEVENVTSAGLALGTPSFMSPEQAAGKRDEVDGRTDIFALGATMFRVFTGKRIHDAEHVVALVVKMATEPAPPIRSVSPAASEVFARVVDRALAFKKEDRYASAAEMRADVRAALETLAVSRATTLNVLPYSTKSPRALAPGEDAPAKKAPARELGKESSGGTSSDETSSPKRSSWGLLFLLIGGSVAASFALSPSLRARVERLREDASVLDDAAASQVTAADDASVPDSADIAPTIVELPDDADADADTDPDDNDTDGGADDDLDGGSEVDGGGSVVDATVPAVVPAPQHHRRPPPKRQPRKWPRKRPR